MKRVKRYKNLRETDNLKIRRTEHHTPATPVNDLLYKIKEILGIKPPIDKQFKKELQNIKGIGIKTSTDIVNVYPTKEYLKQAIQKGEHLPFTNDIENTLKQRW